MTHTNAQKLEILNTFRAGEGLAPFAMWKVARHQPMLDAYRAAQEAEFEASQAELAAQTVRPTADEKPEVVTPVAPVAKPEKPAKPAAAVKPETTAKVEPRNGVRFPRVGGLCWQAWQMFDELHKANPGFDVKVALAEGAKRNFNDNNVRTELCCWRKYHGIAARKTKG